MAGQQLGQQQPAKWATHESVCCMSLGLVTLALPLPPLPVSRLIAPTGRPPPHAGHRVEALP
jgi:hypothetical protein